ncbi:MAG: hypothetical protein MZU84_08560 [Sphingobacterium sp.]|nr:hypothetical protein [Sphingobacterium sp.]
MSSIRVKIAVAALAVAVALSAGCRAGVRAVPPSDSRGGRRRGGPRLARRRPLRPKRPWPVWVTPSRSARSPSTTTPGPWPGP